MNQSSIPKQYQIIRNKCIDSLLELNPENKNYIVELEKHLCDWADHLQHSGNFHEYYRKYIQLYFNLKRYYNHLTTTYSPSELIFLDSSKLNPKFQHELEDNKIQNAIYKDIQDLKIGSHDKNKDNNDNDDDDDDDDGSLQCGKCKGRKNISTTLRQLRSADEPMSAFHSCGRCGHHWRVG